MKITNFEIENVKKVSLVRMNVSPTGMTVIGGKNAQGKSSVLDAIVYALGGEKYRPTNLQREGGMSPARIRLQLENGLTVERKGKNASLTVTDATGKKAGQALLNSFIEELALNLPKFLAMNDADKAEVLLNTLGIEEKLKTLDLKEQTAYDRRHEYGIVRDQKKKYAAELPEYDDVPDVPVKIDDIVDQLEKIHARNNERERQRNQYRSLTDRVKAAEESVESLHQQLMQAELKLSSAKALLEAAENPSADEDESTAELEQQIGNLTEINGKIKANLDKAAALEIAAECDRNYDELSAAVDAVRAERLALLNGVQMPLPELTIGKNNKGVPILLYKGQTWDGMSGMERIKVGTAIVQALKPECKFILLDGMECFDSEQLEAFDKWLTELDLQAICTRVGSDHASIIIEDGYAVQEGAEPAPEVPDMMSPIPMTMNNEEEQDF